ncbi:hypothetical protein ABFS82_02G128900 [Erythranthe guttata]|nr:PREDICTED: protein YLS3-like [Erythranthe guttata]|eukprot:XP_012849663.1 PREDICTED: protein YLS3-like [Erythranthe guttata]
MNNFLTNNIILILVLMLVCYSGECDNAKEKAECTESLVGLATCLPYVGGTAKSPTPDCCAGLKQLLKTNKKCLCVIIKDRNDPDLGLDINVTLALGLPTACNAPANISECPALLNLPPDSPDAQIFYRNSSSATPPVSNVPNPAISVTPSPGGSIQQKSSGCGIKKRCMGLGIFFCGLVLFFSFTADFIIIIII